MKNAFATALFTVGLLAAPVALAHQGAKGVVKQRMDAMDEVAANLKAVNGMLRGNQEMDRAAMEAALRQIADHARMLPDKFPAGADTAPSEAGPAIWTDPEGFSALFVELETAASAMAGLAPSADTATLGQAFAPVAATCKACHADYRVNRD